MEGKRNSFYYMAQTRSLHVQPCSLHGSIYNIIWALLITKKPLPQESKGFLILPNTLQLISDLTG